jgi:hypothetical protein
MIIGCFSASESGCPDVPRDNVDRTARRIRNDDLDQLVGIGLCMGAERRHKEYSEHEHTQHIFEPNHTLFEHGFPPKKIVAEVQSMRALPRRPHA